LLKQKMTEQKAVQSLNLPPKTKWPDAAPLEGEELIVSISCGNSHLHWATHYGDSEDYNPQIFWRTPHLKESDMEDEDLLAILSRNLPDDPHDHIFGKSVDATLANATSQSQKRTAPLISVYVVSTNQTQESLLAKIWNTIPSRFFVMTGEDFFKKEEGRYDTMGTDRLATLTGAVHLHGHPALVFDGGTATTYSATDAHGQILGGGIGPGIASKFRSLTKDTDALPDITTEEVIARVNEAQEKGKPLPTFARNTQEAMMADAFQEFALKGRNVIEHWLGKSYANNEENNIPPTQKFNSDKRVICTGGDGDILMQLLQPHYGGVIEHMETNNHNGGGGSGSRNGALARRYIVESSKHLIHYGIACVLAAQVGLRKSKDAFRKNPNEEHVGKRVAKHFEVEADDGDNIYRGKVTEVVAVEGRDHEFRIQYDDGDSEDVTSSELFDMFKLFSVHGEKTSGKSAPPRGRKKHAAKRGRKAISLEDIEATEADVASAPAKSAETKSNEAPPEEKEAAATPYAAKRVKTSVNVEKAGEDVPKFPVKSATKDKAKGASAEKKKADATVEKAKPANVEKAVVAAPTESNKADAEKVKRAAQASDEGKAEEGSPTEEKKPAAKKAIQLKISDYAKVRDVAPTGEKKPAARRAAKPSKSPDDVKALDTPTSPTVTRPTKRRTNAASSSAQKRPTAKRGKTTVNNILAMVNSSDPNSFVRTRIAKDFDGETFYGTIMEYDDSETPAYWHVEYDDGDEEDYSKKDLVRALKYYEKEGKHDKNS